MGLTRVLAELLEAGDVDYVRGQAGVHLAQGDAGGGVSRGPEASLVQKALLNVAAHLAAIRPPVAQVVLPLPYGHCSLRLYCWPGAGGGVRRTVPRPAITRREAGGGGGHVCGHRLAATRISAKMRRRPYSAGVGATRNREPCDSAGREATTDRSGQLKYQPRVYLSEKHFYPSITGLLASSLSTVAN